MTKYLGFILTVFISTSLFSQKIMEKQIDVTGIERIEFLADAIFNIKIYTVQSNTLELRASVAGENAEHVVLDMKQIANSLIITPGFTPFFLKENDKLAAHKVIAIELDVLVPENRYVSVSSKIASLQCSGNFKYFQAYLEDGVCAINNFKGNGIIQTKTGDITVQTYPEVGVKGLSKSGIVSGKPYQKQFYTLEINTLSGDITILEIN